MNIEINLKELKEFKRIFKSDFIQVTAIDNKVELYSMDCKVEILKVVPDAKVHEDGIVIIPTYLIDVLPPGDIIITEKGLNNENTLIDFKEFNKTATYKPFSPDEILVKDIKEEVLKEILEVKHAIAKDECRPILENICLRKNDAVSLDGYRLSKRTTDFNLDRDIFIYKDIVKIINKIKIKGTSFIGIQEEDVIFKIDEYFIRFKNISGDFIEYNGLIPIKENKVVCDVDSNIVFKVLQRAKRLGEYLLNVSISNGHMDFMINRFDITFNERINVECNGEIELALNINYLIDTFKVLKGEVRIELTGKVTPVIFKQSGKLELILPIRLSK
ncbi:hypothetical protein [Clostridium sp.]|uniref:hypothetical protein n=1 Tax=Clostridium sp. TaxID=1506 RepID=UPI0039943E0A